MSWLTRRYRSAGVLSLAVLLGIAMVSIAALAPLRSSAADKPQVFRPERFVAVPVPAHDGKHQGVTPKQEGELQQQLEALLGKPDHEVKPQRVDLASVAAAEQELHARVRRPSSLPTGLDGEPRVAMLTAGSATYTLDLARIHDQLAKEGFADLQLPPTLHGAQITLDMPPAVVLAYGPKDHPLVIAQGRAPSLAVPGNVDVAALRDLLLSYPRLPAEARPTIAALRAIADWRTTVPVPVGPSDASRAVSVDGADGLLVRSGRAGEAGVIWFRQGSLYAVGGPLSEDQVIAVASSLR